MYAEEKLRKFSTEGGKGTRKEARFPRFTQTGTMMWTEVEFRMYNVMPRESLKKLYKEVYSKILRVNKDGISKQRESPMTRQGKESRETKQNRK